jgi:hypothetical protein
MALFVFREAFVSFVIGVLGGRVQSSRFVVILEWSFEFWTLLRTIPDLFSKGARKAFV